MATDILMPRLSDSMEEGTVLKWLVEPGGEVKRGEPLVEIETDKANMTYEADTDGVLLEVLAQEGDTLAIGEVIARVGEPGEEPASSAAVEGEEEGGRGEAARSGGRRASGEAAAASAGGRRTSVGADREPATATVERRQGASGAGDGRIQASPV